MNLALGWQLRCLRVILICTHFMTIFVVVMIGKEFVSEWNVSETWSWWGIETNTHPLFTAPKKQLKYPWSQSRHWCTNFLFETKWINRIDLMLSIKDYYNDFNILFFLIYFFSLWSEAIKTEHRFIAIMNTSIWNYLFNTEIIINIQRCYIGEL